jgi:peroxiredoxin/predicted 2-oxoglutarate/Fe(II)-dependent dioxygenase YbiX
MTAEAASAGTARYDTLFVGDPAPWFRQRCVGHAKNYSFDMSAGRVVVLCFYGASADPRASHALSLLRRNDALFDGLAATAFGVSIDPADETAPDTARTAAGLRHFADYDGAVSRLFGVLPRDGTRAPSTVRRAWFVLDPRLRVIGIFPLTEAGGDAAMRFVRGLLPWRDSGAAAQVPVLLLPHVFEPGFCATLIQYYQATGAVESGIFTEDADYDAATVNHAGFKRRRDCRIADKALVDQAQTRIFRRVVPELRHAFQFNATKLERLIVACYDAEEGGRFGPHRDNTIAATAHRRFAVSINLNDDFEGGGIAFPEYGQRAFRPPAGGALLFSCSLMHVVLPMTRGKRFACLPFVYDEAGAALRRRNAEKTGWGAPPPPSPA